MSNTKGTKKPGSRTTREHVDSVKKNAAEVGKELDAEQAESVGELARALGEISEGEGFAHLDSRLAFIERQVERLSARKDEADRGVQGELAVMRARVEDALEAVGATAEQQREALASLEKRLAGVVSDAERGSTDVVATLRKEIVGKVHETARRLEKLDARIRGESAAFQEGFEERSRALAQSVTEAKANFEESLAESQEEVQAELEASRTRIVEDLTVRLKDLEGNVRDLTERSSATVQKAEADLDAFLKEASDRAAAAEERASSVTKSIEGGFAQEAEKLHRRLSEEIEEIEQRLSGGAVTIDEALTSGLAEIRQLLDTRDAKNAQEFEAHRQEISANLEALKAEVSDALSSSRTESAQALVSKSEELARMLDSTRAAIEAALAGLRTSVDESLVSQSADLEERLSDEQRVANESRATERRETQARLSEWGAELRLDSQKLREAVENRSKAMAEALDVVRKDLLTRIQASEEKTAGTAIRLQSLLDQQRREIVTDEEEWSRMLNEVGEDLSLLKIRVEELAGRVSAAEARRATEKGSSNASVESMVARVAALEQKVREAVEDMVAKQGTRLEMLASQVAGMSETEVAAEEQLGAVDYLKRRVGEMAERLDEIVVKVNAIGRYVTKPGSAARSKSLPMLPDDLSERLSALEQAIQKSEAKVHESSGVAARLEALERAIAELSKSIAARPESPPFVSPAPPAAPGSGIDLSVKVEEPTPKQTSTTILPSKKRRW